MYNDDDEKDDGDDDDDYEDCRASVKRLSSLARARTWLAPRFVPKQSRANISQRLPQPPLPASRAVSGWQELGCAQQCNRRF